MACIWESMRPGMTVRPPRSMMRVAGPAKPRMSAERPTATIVSSRTANASAMVERSSSVTILPLTSAVSGDCAATGRANAANAKAAARRRPTAARPGDRFLIVSSLIISMPRRQRGQSRGVAGQRIAAPDDMTVGPHQDQIIAVNLAGMLVGQVEGTVGRAVGRESAAESCRVVLAGKAQQRMAVAVADAILHGSSISEPDMGQPHPRIGARYIVDEI